MGEVADGNISFLLAQMAELLRPPFIPTQESKVEILSQ